MGSYWRRAKKRYNNFINKEKQRNNTSIEERQRTHAIKRAKQRFELELSNQDYFQLSNYIASGKAKFIRNQSQRKNYMKLNWMN